MAAKENWEKFLDESDIALLKTYGEGPYAKQIKNLEGSIKDLQVKINEKIGVKELDTGLAPPNLWDLPADMQKQSESQALQVHTFLDTPPKHI
ncbi:26S protease regulatory subunit 7-like protein [Smittium culicis]|uniref:26S protease regulatory subunit 7-like protein n=1 Tax=Smittium culicis TaxID=133412 RepID=A0A1R1Y140_9FUNG|nr:26S protease regulatory subunit 7-like protein [Smittium culicis]